MNERTMTAMYDTRGAAESARDALVGLGVSSDSISIHGTDSGTGAVTERSSGGFWSGLADLFLPDDDRGAYAEGIERGGHLLTARVPDGLEDQAADILERSEPIDMDARVETWRSSGWTGYQGATAGGAGAAAGAGLAETGTAYESTSMGQRSGSAGTGYEDRTVATNVVDTDVDVVADVPASGSTYQTQGASMTQGTTTTGSAAFAQGDRVGRDDDVIQAAEEQLRVGKREVGRGSVRVRSYVVERPVEEQVSLREETVQVERRPVDRPLGAGDQAFTEKEIEFTERGEEAVVSKEARVTEEIALRKDVDTRTETVRDTVRKQEVEVDDDRNVAGGLTRDERTDRRADRSGI
jgi:uncharacterized protein (TIGR02271 family)